jgi:two-component system sensor histidine kinase ChvG
MVEQAVARLEHLLSTVREISMIDSQLEEEGRSEVRLGQLLSELVEGFRLRGTGMLTYDLELPGQEVCVSASPERLVRVFENVLDNARSFSPERGTVWVRLARRADLALVTIRDQGPGIPEQHLDQIFARFFSFRDEAGEGSGMDAPAGNSEHTGLGLAIARAIIDGYGGTISARNSTEGGAIFEIQLNALR